jgi:hypothetical protein
MKCSSYTWIRISYSSFVPNHIKFKITSNSRAHKHVDPPKGMCQFKQYLSTTKRYVGIRISNNIRYPRAPYHFKLFLIFIHFHNPLAIVKPRYYKKENCHQLSHQTPWNLWLNNLKHTRKNLWDDKKTIGISKR